MSAAHVLSPAAVPFPAPRAGSEPQSSESGDDARTRLVASRLRGALEALGLDLNDPHLADTPLRAARAWRFLFSGLEDGAEPELRTFPNAEGYSRTVAVKGIRFHSVCAHHLLPFWGTADVGYVPRDRVVGLSKLARVVELFARRPQTQERLTEQVAGFLDERLSPGGVIVVVKARHLCMEMRGVEKVGSHTVTSAVRGDFEQEARRREFLRRGRS